MKAELQYPDNKMLIVSLVPETDAERLLVKALEYNAPAWYISAEDGSLTACLFIPRGE